MAPVLPGWKALHQPTATRMWGHPSFPAQLDSPNGRWTWNTSSCQLLIPHCHLLVTACDPSKWELGLFWSLPAKHLQEDETEAELQQLLCPSKEQQCAHKNRACSTDTSWAQAYKRSTAISSVWHCCCFSQQQQSELLPEAQKFVHRLLHHHKDDLILPAWYPGQEWGFQQSGFFHTQLALHLLCLDVNIT